MIRLVDYPLLALPVSIATLWLSVWVGGAIFERWRSVHNDVREEYGVVLTATLTLLALVIGFTFSMAASRYDQRKGFEEAEANAIGTEYVRADLLPAVDAKQVQALLKAYVDQRVLFYVTRNEQKLDAINTQTALLQANLWKAAGTGGMAQPGPLTALAVSGMNDVLNSQGYTQAAWWNRVPVAAWCLLVAIAISGSILLGYRPRRSKVEAIFRLILPVIVSISFAVIADIDSPRGGVIKVEPQNLVSLSEYMRKN